MCQTAFDTLLVAGLKQRGQLFSIPDSSSGIMRDLSRSGLNGITGKEQWRAKSVSTSSSRACFHLVCPLLSERKITVFHFTGTQCTEIKRGSSRQDLHTVLMKPSPKLLTWTLPVLKCESC